MRLFRRKNHHGGSDEAARAKLAAEQQLEEAKSHSGEVDHVVGALRTHYRENHMAEAIISSMQLKHRRRFGHS